MFDNSVTHLGGNIVTKQKTTTWGKGLPGTEQTKVALSIEARKGPTLRLLQATFTARTLARMPYEGGGNTNQEDHAR